MNDKTDPEAYFDAHGTVEHFVPFDRRNLWPRRGAAPSCRRATICSRACSPLPPLADQRRHRRRQNAVRRSNSAFAIAAGANFLNWNGVRPARVMYLDGEMPAETMKERIEAAAAIYGDRLSCTPTTGTISAPMRCRR